MQQLNIKFHYCFISLSCRFHVLLFRLFADSGVLIQSVYHYTFAFKPGLFMLNNVALQNSDAFSNKKLKVLYGALNS